MLDPESAPRAGFFFALPRLFERWRGGENGRSENNWLEANLVGTLVHLLAYLFAYEIILAREPGWLQFVLFLPLAFAVWVFWLLVLYLNSWIIRGLRCFGLTSGMPDRYAQSFLIHLMTTGFTCRLVLAGSIRGWLGILWLAAVALNLLAALFLAFRDGVSATAR